ncbi:MAG TPA: 50S ribosomal protein L10 [Deinococcales bacterium]|nr:50S ribosomal protein L10 [Deinococcales bacterium]
MANPRNEAAVKELRSLLEGGDTFFLVDYQGLSAADLNSLRTKVRTEGGRILVAKNTLINIVLNEQGVEGFADQLTGPTALLLTGEDPVGSVKVVTDFAKDHAKNLPVAKGGMLQGVKIGPETFEKVAKLPGLEQIQSELVGVLTAPLQQLVGVLEGPQRNLVTVMNNHKDNLEEA